MVSRIRACSGWDASGISSKPDPFCRDLRLDNVGGRCGDGILVRWPLGSPHWLVFLKSFLLLGATISAAILALARIERRGGSYALVLASTLTVLFLPCLAWLIGWAADLIVDPALLGLFAAGIVQIVAVRGRAPPGQVRPAILCGLFAGLGYFVLINSRGLANVLSPEEAIVGLSNLDTLFHASIANMLVKHGALSMGLDGFVPIVYHFLSHIWLGCLALWLATGTLHVYYIGAQVVAIPMLFFSLLLAVYSLRPAGQRLGNGALVVQFPLLLLLLTELQGWTSYLVSESYFLAIIIFLLALPLLSETARIENHRRLGLNAAGLAIAGVLMALSKVSVGTVFLAASCFQVLRQLALRPMMFLKLTIPALLVAAVAAAFLFKDFGGTAKMYAPFSFVQDFRRWHGAILLQTSCSYARPLRCGFQQHHPTSAVPKSLPSSPLRDRCRRCCWRSLAALPTIS